MRKRAIFVAQNIGILGLAIAMRIITSSVASADSQLDRLILALGESADHRTRTEAAFQLGQHPDERARSAVLAALGDPSVAVRLAALAALARIGDARSIEVIATMDEENHVVREQGLRTRVLLEERYPASRLPPDWQQVDEVVAIGGLFDGTSEEADRSRSLRRYLSRHLRMRPGIAVIESPADLESLGRTMRRHGLRPLLVTGSLQELTRSHLGEDVFWQAIGSVTVLDYYEKSIRATVTDRAWIRGSTSGGGPRRTQEAEERVVEELMRAIATDLGDRLEEL